MEASMRGADLGDRRFVLRPCFAADWPQTVRAFVAISVACGSIAIAFALAGYWPILAFAGLELAALGAALYVSARRSLDCEVVRVTEREIEIEKGRGRPQQRWVLQRAWTEVVLTLPAGSARSSELTLRSRGQRVVLGGFLDEEERRALARALHRVIGPMAEAAPLEADDDRPEMPAGDSLTRVHGRAGSNPFGE
jgi:uncharacterized membrane protein